MMFFLLIKQFSMLKVVRLLTKIEINKVNIFKSQFLKGLFLKGGC
jgi:hypothetical protein